MKKTLNIALIGSISIIMIASCAKKKPIPPVKSTTTTTLSPTNSLLVGTWLMTKIKSEYGVIQDFSDPTKQSGQYYIRFYADGKTYDRLSTTNMNNDLTNATVWPVSTYVIKNNVIIYCCASVVGDTIVQLDAHNLQLQDYQRKNTTYYTK